MYEYIKRNQNFLPFIVEKTTMEVSLSHGSICNSIPNQHLPTSTKRATQACYMTMRLGYFSKISLSMLTYRHC